MVQVTWWQSTRIATTVTAGEKKKRDEDVIKGKHNAVSIDVEGKVTGEWCSSVPLLAPTRIAKKE